ncbi:MAG: T9SS type A sorting domain-containing protein [Bacteroidota bacterium]|nr:T9SS type A sorting domain-containing protein [Bacteroidota bacterium]
MKWRSYMIQKTLKLSAILLFVIGLTGLQAQESINASGGEATGSGGAVNYSVGQMVYKTHTGINSSVAEGVQQPYEISVVNGTDEAKNINLSVSAYPNPTTNYLTLSISDNIQTNHDLSLMSYQLFDMNGKLLQNEKITGNQTSIVMSNLVPATYFVKVIVKTQGLASQEIKTFKIIKTK